MKRTFALVALATLAVASCSKSEYLGQVVQPVDDTLSPIQIGSDVSVPTKADATGAAAAEQLGKKFFVWGRKTINSTPSSVFDTVPVHFTDEDEWTYVSDTESLRYWDSNADAYDFIAISDANPLTNVSHLMEKVAPQANVYADGFRIAQVTADELAKIHVSNVMSVNNTAYSSPVDFVFADAAAKIRVAFYNAIPGYEVDVDGFYLANNSISDNTALTGTFYGKASYDVSNTGEITLTGTPVHTNEIVLGDKIVESPNTGQYIGKTIATATYDHEDKAYTDVLPVMDDGSDITLKVTYRMISGHEHISRTTEVTIPKEYTSWKPNYAYTYTFKITDNDLHPITFGAIVKDAVNRELATTIDGDNPVNISLYSDDSDFAGLGGIKVGKDVYFSVTGVPASTFDVHTAYTADDEINGSNAGSKIHADDWTYCPLTTHGRYEVKAAKAGNYVIRVTWSQEVEGSAPVTMHAYMVFKSIE